MLARRRLALLILGCTLATTAVAADESPPVPVTPYRPGAADPAELPVPGFVEFELGWDHTRADDHHRLDRFEYLFKYAFNEDMGLLLGGDSYLHLDARGEGSRDGIGDTEIAWKQRFGVSEQTALGLIAGVQFPTASEGLGEKGEIYRLTGIYSVDIGRVRLDLNAGATRHQRREPGVSVWEAEWSAAIGWPLMPDLEIGFDLSGTHRKGESDNSVLLAALSWELHPRLVLDAGVSCGLNDEARDFTVFTGLSVSLGRL